MIAIQQHKVFEALSIFCLDRQQTCPAKDILVKADNVVDKACCFQIETGKAETAKKDVG